MSEVDEADDKKSDVDHGNRTVHIQPAKKPHSTAMVCPFTCLCTMLIYMEWQGNIVVDKPVKKAKTNNNSEHGATEGSAQSSTSAGVTPSTSSNGTTSSGRVHYINGHLPPALQEDRKWTKLMLPALVTWAGSLADPWVIPDQDLMCTLRIIVTTISPGFQDLTAIRPGTAIFSLVLMISF